MCTTRVAAHSALTALPATWPLNSTAAGQYAWVIRCDYCVIHSEFMQECSGWVIRRAEHAHPGFTHMHAVPSLGDGTKTPIQP